MRVLVTGAAGFIGSHIASMVREAGHEVRGLDSLTPAVHSGRPSHVAANLVVGDVRRPAVVHGRGERIQTANLVARLPHHRSDVGPDEAGRTGH